MVSRQPRPIRKASTYRLALLRLKTP
jgi:hypothetical protein